MKNTTMQVETTWVEPAVIDPKTDKALTDYSRVVKQLLYVRGIRKKSDAERFLKPSWDQINDPFSLCDTKLAAKIIEKAISDKQRIFVHGDFDADGICATAILWEYLYRVRGADVLPYLPSRVDEGYGMSEKSISAIIKQGGALIITVDCGIRDAALIEKFRKKMDFVVTDHHQPAPDWPAGAATVVHPMHPDGGYPEPNIAGAAVAWKLVSAMEKHRNKKKFDMTSVPGLDLAAFATICDLMPLSGENRVMTSCGLNVLRSFPRTGIRALSDDAGVQVGAIRSYDIGYVLGPRINAAGRIGKPIEALRLMTTEKSDVARSLATKLGVLNRERQQMTDELLAEVREQIEQEDVGRHLYFASGDDWPEGIIGIVAGKIQEQYHRPVVLVTKGKTGAKGSARSITGFSIVDAIEQFSSLLGSHGGHALAAGFSIDPKNIEPFKKALEDYAGIQITKAMLKREVHADAVVDAGELTWEVVQDCQRLEPYGFGNRRPTFWMKNAVIVDMRCVGAGKHCKLTVKGNSGLPLECIFFNVGDRSSLLAKGSIIDAIGHLEINEWNGRESLQFNVEDVRAG